MAGCQAEQKFDFCLFLCDSFGYNHQGQKITNEIFMIRLKIRHVLLWVLEA
jgi:hypothetical protein